MPRAALLISLPSKSVIITLAMPLPAFFMSHFESIPPVMAFVSISAILLPFRILVNLIFLVVSFILNQPAFIIIKNPGLQIHKLYNCHGIRNSEIFRCRYRYFYFFNFKLPAELASFSV